MKILFTFAFACLISTSLYAQELAYETDEKYFVDGEYRGRFTPDADYVLSGKFREDLGPLPKVDFRYLSKEEGYDPGAITAVPEPGVHPRVLMSPDDIVRIRAEVAKGDQAHPYFRIVWNDIISAKPGDHHHGLAATAIVALVNEDEKLGRELAELLVEEALFREPMAEIMNTHPEMDGTRDNWYYYARTQVQRVGGELYKDAYQKGGQDLVRQLAQKSVEFGNDGDKHSSGHLFNSVLRSYDYIHPFMTDDERAIVRRVIAKLTAGRYTTGMELPGNMFINNHMSMGEDLLILHLAIEGEEGYDPRILREYSKAVQDKITYDISPAGNLHEKCKGFIPERATLAITRRANMPDSGALPLLGHSHIKAMVWAKVMDSTNVPYGTAEIGERDNLPRYWWMGFGSGPWMDQFFNWAFLVKYAYPNDPAVDFFYKERLTQQGFGPPRPGADAPLPKPRIRYTWRDMMILGATAGLLNEDGQSIDYNQDGLPKDILAKTDAYVDMQRGVAASRSSWDPDAMHVHFESRSDNYMTGHETPEAGDFNLVSHGVQWSLRREWYMDPFFRNVVLIDGRAGTYPPSHGDLMQVNDSDVSSTFVSDSTHQYNWWQGGKNFWDWHGAYTDSEMHMAPWKQSRLIGRKFEPAFAPHMREYQENLAGLDWGAWHGESRGPQMYHQLNNVDHVFRTLHMTKGDTPYILMVDDARKDDQVHQYDWCMTLERDVVLYDSDSAVRNRFLPNLGEEIDDISRTDLILTLKDVPETRYDRYGIKSHRKPKKGDPMLLVRVLNRNTDYPFPQPVFEEGQGHGHLASRIRIPALAVDPEFKVMLFPHRFGDKLPVTSWNADRSVLTVLVGNHTDVYSFGETDRERTVFTMQRDGQAVASSDASPAMPQLATAHGWTPDRNTPDAPRTFVLTAEDAFAFANPPIGQAIRYTLDGSDPTEQSTLFTGPFSLEKSATIKAKTFARHWPFSDSNDSQTLTTSVAVRSIASPTQANASSLKAGLVCEVYEKHHTLFDEKTGIFTGKKKMLPELTNASLTCLTDGIQVPKVEPKLPAAEMANGYYVYKGFIQIDSPGVHGFKLDSCGPVVLKVGGQDVINVTGSYGLSQTDRFGQAALATGIHPFELTVCDPAFWKDGQDGPYLIQLSQLAPGASDYAPVTADMFSTDRTDVAPQPEREIPVGNRVAVSSVQPGLIMNAYDRIGMFDELPNDGVPEDYFTIDSALAPYRSAPTLTLQPSTHAGQIVEYTGYLIADAPGVYEFQLDRAGANQLWIDNQLVTQNRVDAPEAVGAIRLDAGSHTFRLALAHSKPSIHVKLPETHEFVPAQIGMFARPSDAKAKDDGRMIAHIDGESLSDEGTVTNLAGSATIHLRKGEQVQGKTGKGLKLTGKDSRLEITGLASPDDEFSLALWLRVDNRAEAFLIDNSWGSHPGVRLRGHSLQASYFRGGTNAGHDLRTNGADKGEWVHVVVTFDNTVRLYINGEAQDWQVKDVQGRSARVTDLTVFRDLDGTVDDVRLYNQALTPQAVEKLFSGSGASD